jgi:hypothetical protein
MHGFDQLKHLDDQGNVFFAILSIKDFKRQYALTAVDTAFFGVGNFQP